ncbi:MAG: hypothetical protein HY273_04825 [Gammaproteobacteria bacterium]|nr:hypothetical protein [Gammaproteobacteria bacterium]
MFAKTVMAVALTAVVLSGGVAVAADTATAKTVEALNVEKVQLKGKQVAFKGKVVKVNNNIMKKNFLHIQDGTGKEGTNDVTVTSAQTAKEGDVVSIVGKVMLDRDFGSGYTYPLIIEDAVITAAK